MQHTVSPGLSLYALLYGSVRTETIPLECREGLCVSPTISTAIAICQTVTRSGTRQSEDQEGKLSAPVAGRKMLMVNFLDSIDPFCSSCQCLSNSERACRQIMGIRTILLAWMCLCYDKMVTVIGLEGHQPLGTNRFRSHSSSCVRRARYTVYSQYTLTNKGMCDSQSFMMMLPKAVRKACIIQMRSRIASLVYPMNLQGVLIGQLC